MAADTATHRDPASLRGIARRRPIAARVHLMDLALRIEGDRPPTAHHRIEVDRLLMEEAHPRIVHRLRPTMVAVDRLAVVVDIVAEAAVAAAHTTVVVVEEAVPTAEAAVVVDTPRLAEAMVGTAKKD